MLKLGKKLVCGELISPFRYCLGCDNPNELELSVPIISTTRSLFIIIMTTNQHRARARLDLMAKEYKWLFDALPKIRDTAEWYWPDYVYVPSIELEKLISKTMNREEFMRVNRYTANKFSAFLSVINAGNTWATWRLTQGVYRFDETLYPHLLNTQGIGEIPVDILCRLPEWCVYLETPGFGIPRLDGTTIPMYGAWARIDLEEKNQMALAITQDIDRPDCGDSVIAPEERLLSIPRTQKLPLVSGTSVEDSLSAMLGQWPKPGLEQFANVPREEVIRKASEWIKPIVNLLLYLCAGADYTGPAPQNPQPKKTKRGPRLFPPNKPTVWDVGVRMGSALRAAYAAQSASDSSSDGGAGSGRQVRPHIRRAHWHGFRSGTRLTPEGQPIPAEKRRFDLRWLPPIAVNIDDMGNDNLPAVIHSVK
jgi:hypothetical protein